MFWPADNSKISFGGLKRALPTHSGATSTTVMTSETTRNSSRIPNANSQSNTASGGT